MRPNTALRAWRDGRQTIGAWLSIDSSYTAEIIAQVGFDWACLDTQHGVIGDGDVMPMLQAISTTDTIPFVRVPWNDPATIMRVLDWGAYGVVVPLVDTAEDARRAVAACRYPPAGIRSSGPARGRLYGGADYQEHANEEIACVVMIETAQALENLDGILSTPGVDAAYIGPADLAYALGLTPTGDNSHPTHAAAVQRIFDACLRHGVAPGIHTSSVEYASRYLEMGFQMVTLGSEHRWMQARAAEELAKVRPLARASVAAPKA